MKILLSYFDGEKNLLPNDDDDDDGDVRSRGVGGGEWQAWSKWQSMPY